MSEPWDWRSGWLPPGVDETPNYDAQIEDVPAPADDGESDEDARRIALERLIQEWIDDPTASVRQLIEAIERWARR